MSQLSYPSSMPVPQLSVVMPCYNENAQIETLLKEWSRAFQDKSINAEFVVINDGSLDGTSRVLDRLRQEIQNLRIVHQLNSGHGRSVRRGYELSRGEWVLQLDSSGRFETSDFDLFWNERENFDLIVANRTHRLDSLTRKISLQFLRGAIESLFKIEILDPDVSFRLFRREAVLGKLFTLPKAVQGINLAMTILLKKLSPQRVCEVKVPYRLRALHKGRTGVYALLKTLKLEVSELLKLRFFLKTLSTNAA